MGKKSNKKEVVVLPVGLDDTEAKMAGVLVKALQKCGFSAFEAYKILLHVVGAFKDTIDAMNIEVQFEDSEEE